MTNQNAVDAFREAFLRAGGPIGAGDDAIRAGLEAVDRLDADPQPLPLSVGRIQAYCGRVERPHGGHVWNTSVDRWCPGDEVPGWPEPRFPGTAPYPGGEGR